MSMLPIHRKRTDEGEPSCNGEDQQQQQQSLANKRFLVPGALGSDRSPPLLRNPLFYWCTMLFAYFATVGHQASAPPRPSIPANSNNGQESIAIVDHEKIFQEISIRRETKEEEEDGGTAIPITDPTAIPTTKSPSTNPTISPSKAPTTSSSSDLTSSPTASPSGGPTVSPTSAAIIQEPQNLCLDEDDPPLMNPDNPKKCHCLDPSESVEGTIENWHTKHEANVEAANNAPSNVDVVLIGDSITNRWTKSNKQRELYQKVFNSFFNKSQGAPLDGLALGVGGDMSMNLQWRLGNGMLPDSLQPKTWFILIGTNDLGYGCSKNTTLTAILNVLRYLHEQRPETPIILHGLLPRGSPNDYTLRYQDDIAWINEGMKHFCRYKEDFYHLDSADVFLTANNQSSSKADDEFILNATLMKDGIHPTVAGYEAWAPRIVEQVQEVIKRFQQRKKVR